MIGNCRHCSKTNVVLAAVRTKYGLKLLCVDCWKLLKARRREVLRYRSAQRKPVQAVQRDLLEWGVER